MRSGLRSHCEYTMTWVSPRSGSASSATWRIDHHPAIAAVSAIATTATRCFADRSMMRLIMAASAASRQPHAALGIEQERPRDHDALAGAQSAEDLDAIAGTAANIDPPRLERSWMPLDEDRVVQAGGYERFGRHDNRRRSLDLQVDVHEHVGPEHEPGVVRFEPDLRRLRRRIELRQDVCTDPG